MNCEELWLEPDQELVVAEVDYQGAAFASAPAEVGVPGPRGAQVQGQQELTVIWDPAVAIDVGS